MGTLGAPIRFVLDAMTGQPGHFSSVELHFGRDTLTKRTPERLIGVRPWTGWGDGITGG
jgi:hypothetical protein